MTPRSLRLNPNPFNAPPITPLKLPAAAPDIIDCANGAKIFANVLSGIKLFLHILAPPVSYTHLRAHET